MQKSNCILNLLFYIDLGISPLSNGSHFSSNNTVPVHSNKMSAINNYIRRSVIQDWILLEVF